jgi:hypothetical protein
VLTSFAVHSLSALYLWQIDDHLSGGKLDGQQSAICNFWCVPRELTYTGIDIVICKGGCTTYYDSRFCTWDYSSSKHSPDRKRNIRIVREFIFKSLSHANNTKKVKNPTTMTCHRHYRHQAGSLLDCRALVNARKTNKETNLYHW